MELDNISIKLDNGVDFLQLVAQLQTQCQPILVVVEKEGKQTLHYYDKKRIPKSTSLVKTYNNVYHFMEKDTSYYVFGEIAFKLFSEPTKKMKPIITEYVSNHIILYDKGKKYKFPYPEKKFITIPL